jgi:hypothetical protein
MEDDRADAPWHGGQAVRQIIRSQVLYQLGGAFSGKQSTVPLADAFARGVGGPKPHPDTPPLLLALIALDADIPALPADALPANERRTLDMLMSKHRERHWRASGSMHPPESDRDEEERLCGIMIEYMNEYVLMRLLWPDTWALLQQLCPDISRGQGWELLRSTTMHTCIRETYAAMAENETGEPAAKRQRALSSAGGDDTSSSDEERDERDDSFGGKQCQGVPPGMAMIKSCNGIAACLLANPGQNLRHRRSPVPKGYSGAGFELLYFPRLGLAPPGHTKGSQRPATSKTTVRSIDYKWSLRIAESAGSPRAVIEPLGNYEPARVTIQPAASGGGGPRARYVALGATIHSFARGSKGCPLKVLMLALNSLGCTGVAGEMPKNGANRRQYVSVIAMLMVLTELVEGASDTQPDSVNAAFAKECWAGWVQRAVEVAKPRMKGGTLDLVMRSLLMMEWANYNVDINVAAVAKLAGPHIDRVGQLLTYPIDDCENPAAAIGFVAGTGNWHEVVAAYLGPGAHWGVETHANKLAFDVLCADSHRTPGAVIRDAAMAAARRLVLSVVTRAPGDGVWGTFCNVLHELNAHGVRMDSSVWPLVDAESGLHPLLTVVCEEACRLGLVDSNYMVSLLSVDSIDEGTVYTALIVPGTATTILAVRGLQFTGPPGIVRTSTRVVLNSPGGDALPMLVALKAARPAPWPADMSLVTTSAILSACGHNGLCFRAKALDVTYQPPLAAAQNRHRLKDPLADLCVSPWRLEADQLLVRQAVANGDLDPYSPSLGRVALDGASYEQMFVEPQASTGTYDATRLIIIPLVTVEPNSIAKVTALYHVYRRASTEYYEQFRGTAENLHDVVEAVRSQCGDDAPLETRQGAFKEHFIERFFSASVTHCSLSPGCPAAVTDGIDDSLLDDTEGGPMSAKIKSLSKSVGVSIISALRQTGTLPKLLKHLAWQAKLNESSINLPDAIDRGIAGAAHILCGVMGLPTYGDRGVTGGLCQAERSMIARRAEVNMLRQSAMHNAAEIEAAKNDREQCMIKQQAAISSLTHEIGAWIDPLAVDGAQQPPPAPAMPPPAVAAALDAATRAQKQFETASATASLLDTLLAE